MRDTEPMSAEELASPVCAFCHKAIEIQHVWARAAEGSLVHALCRTRRDLRGPVDVTTETAYGRTVSLPFTVRVF